MNIAEIMLIVCCLLGVIVMIVVAVDEPKYTWRDVATFDELMLDMQKRFDAIARAIGDQLIPVLARAAESVNAFSDAVKGLKL